MATEPNSADEASKLYNQLMEKENENLVNRQSSLGKKYLWLQTKTLQ